jgi:hypothetical protein
MGQEEAKSDSGGKRDGGRDKAAGRDNDGEQEEAFYADGSHCVSVSTENVTASRQKWCGRITGIL